MITRIKSALSRARIRAEANRAYHDLLAADESILRDIGVRREDVRQAVGRPDGTRN